jgi:RecA/RadA recombinase
MARMIPPYVNQKTLSPGEQEVFRRLKDEPDTAAWIALHSLDIASHRTAVAGEIDFTLIIPSKGVLCLEVKACQTLHRENGVWFYGRNSTGDSRGPFKQASMAMHSLRDRILRLRPDFSKIVFWSGVLFPYVPFNSSSPEWHPWQVIDQHLFRSQPISKSLLGIIDGARRFLSDRQTARWFDSKSLSPTSTECEALTSALRPDFEFFESPKAKIQQGYLEIKKYTEDQFQALDQMEANPRVIFKGPAGTGKTMIALEAAKRARARNQKVLFLCFNRHLGRWLEEETESLRPEVSTSTLHSYMMRLVDVKPDDTHSSQFWTSTLPKECIEKLLNESVEGFDELIIDEAQDILHEDYLDFLDLCLRGGLAAGRWKFFGDFEKQAIYNSTFCLETFARVRSSNAPIVSLRVNCRNTPRIAAFVHLLGGLDPDYKRVLRNDDGYEPQIKYYKSSGEQHNLLIKSFENLSKEGFANGDIVVLSPKADSPCASLIQERPWKDKIKPFLLSDTGFIRFTSVHSFKGLEAPAIIITDIESISGSSEALFYIAATRGLHRVFLLVHENARNDILNTLFKQRS